MNSTETVSAAFDAHDHSHLASPTAPATPQTKVKIDPSWLPYLEAEFQLPYMQKLKSFLVNEQRLHKKIIYPENKNIFAAFDATPFDQVKVVILGQDPYHGPGLAHGLCFSVNPNIPIPPSLQNIFKELKQDLNLPTTPPNGHLMGWAKQGVLLLNTVLTVEKSKAGSHHNQGWEQFTDHVVNILNRKKENLVFILWGSPAQRKGENLDPRKHLIIKAPHPSPLSAYRGFFGGRYFSKTNDYLCAHGKAPIDWSRSA
jgi:uracil-DNA glycosylase